MRNNYKILALGFMLFTLISCNNWEQVPNFDVDQVEGYRPIYATESEQDVKTLPAREIENPGKIYVINDYLLVVDQLKGIHVFNNDNPENPKTLVLFRLQVAMM